MCDTIVLRKTKHGVLERCDSCGLFRLTFGNFYIELDDQELTYFKGVIYYVTIDEDYIKRSVLNYNGKITVATRQTNLFLILSLEELYELQQLLHFSSGKQPRTLLKSEELNCTFSDN